MFSLLILIFIFLVICNVKQIKALHLNIFFLLCAVVSFVFKLKGIYFQELSDLNFYLIFFFALLNFIMFLVDLLKEVRVKAIDVFNSYFFIFLSLESNMMTFLIGLLFFTIQYKKEIEIKSLRDFWVVLLVLSYLVSPSIYLYEFMEIVLISLLTLFALYKDTKNIFYKINFLVLMLLLSFEVSEFVYIYFILISFPLVIHNSKFLRDALIEKIPQSVMVFNKIEQYSKFNNKPVFEFKRDLARIKSPLKSEIPVMHLNLDTRYFIMLIFLVSFFIFILKWGWSL